MQKGLLLIGIVALVLIGGFAVANHKAAAPVEETHTASSTPRTFAWRFETVESPDGVLPPKTQVALITGGDVYNFGSYAGTCAEIKDENLLQGEVAGVLCWWAGHGDEVAVFKDGEEYTVMLGSQEESTAEGDGFRGDFKEIVRIK
jgi:hypothetical protein